MGCAPAPLSAEQLLLHGATDSNKPEHPAELARTTGTDNSAGILAGTAAQQSLQQQQQQQQQQEPATRTAAAAGAQEGVELLTPAVCSAAAYLAANVQAARQPNILEACRRVQQVRWYLLHGFIKHFPLFA